MEIHKLHTDSRLLDDLHLCISIYSHIFPYISIWHTYGNRFLDRHGIQEDAPETRGGTGVQPGAGGALWCPGSVGTPSCGAAELRELRSRLWPWDSWWNMVNPWRFIYDSYHHEGWWCFCWCWRLLSRRRYMKETGSLGRDRKGIGIWELESWSTQHICVIWVYRQERTSINRTIQNQHVPEFRQQTEPIIDCTTDDDDEEEEDDDSTDTTSFDLEELIWYSDSPP